MESQIKGEIWGQGLRVGLVVSRFNELITRLLLQGALNGLADHGVPETSTTVLWVPGAFELPLGAKTLAKSGRCDAVVCLGAVIRGETSHYDLIATHAAQGIGAVSLDTEVPITFGVLATENMEQAMNRAGGKMGNIGHDAALAAIEMARALQAARKLEP